MKFSMRSCVVFFLAVLVFLGANSSWAANKDSTLNDQLVEEIGIGSIENARRLIREGADVNSKIKGVFPLLFMLISYNPEDKFDRVALLIENGADVNAGYMVLTPLWTAVDKGDYDIAELLINNGANVDVDDGEGRTVLGLTAMKGAYDLAELLIKKGADVNAAGKKGTNGEGVTILHSIRDAKMAELFIKNGANVNAKTPQGVTPLMLAENVSIAELLINNGADINAQASIEGLQLTVLDFVQESGSREVADYLLSKGAKSVKN